MNSYTQTTRPYKNFAVAQAHSQAQSNSPTYQFEDNRPESSIQRKIIDTMSNVPEASGETIQLNKRKWTPQQRAQSEKFWKKKEARMKRQKEAKVNRRMREIRGRDRANLPNIAAARIVSGPAGNSNPMPNRQGANVPGRNGATMGYSQMMGEVSNFLHPQHGIRSMYNAGGAQFIQNFDQAGTNVTRRVGIDVEPSGHVNSLGPHINLQTQHNGTIQGGVLADPHTPVQEADPFPNGHPLHGLQPEEKRKFMERYLHSTGFDIQR